MPRKMHANRAVLAGRPIDFYADRRGLWRSPIGSLRTLSAADRARLDALNAAGARTVAALRARG